MTFELAIRLTEIFMAFAFIQQSLEHLKITPALKNILIIRIILCVILVVGFNTPFICIALFITSIIMLHYFQGPYNGGSDRMSLLILTSLTLIHLIPSPQWQDYIFGYLAFQMILSYFMAGWVKIANPEWRSGQALKDVFDFSIYPVNDELRQWQNHPWLLLCASWGVILFELIFPLAFLNQTTLYIALFCAALFHLSNHYFFGFNRFFWIWIAGYPSILWLHTRLISF